MNWRAAMVLLVCLIVIAAVMAQSPIPQPSSYHALADQRTVWGIQNGANVVSNAPFLLIGLWGLWLTARRSFDERVQYAILFLGVALTCFGSSYYHSAPDNSRLLWDRLPMTLGFMALFSAVISERANENLGKRLLLPLLITGVFSVWYWRYTEQQGHGDLRLYLLVQFLPLLCIPLLLLLYPAKYDKASHVWMALLLYASAKAAELFDTQVYASSGSAISGHTLKHFCAALGVLYLAKMVAQRTLISPRSMAAVR